MGIRYSKGPKNNFIDLHIVTYNFGSNINSQYNKNILNNFINKYSESDNIICIQGVRDEDLIETKSNDLFFCKELGLLTITNLKVINSTFVTFSIENYNSLTNYKYGFQKLNLSYFNNNFCVYNLELIPDTIENLILNDVREKEIIELISYICNNLDNDKIHIVTGCFYDLNKGFKELINISKINNIITNLKTGNQESYIFIYNNNLIENFDNLNKYLIDKFNIRIVSHNVYNLNIGEHCPFETVLRLVKN